MSSCSETYIVTSFNELLNLRVDDTCILDNGTSFTIEISIVNSPIPMVICISDISLENNYKECGIITDGQTISFFFDKCYNTKLVGNYVEDMMLPLNHHQTYTLDINKDKIYNIILKKGKDSFMFDAVLSQLPQYKQNNQGEGILDTFLFCLIAFVILITAAFKFYNYFYSLINIY